MMAPQNVFDYCAQTLRRGKLKLGDLILLNGASKKEFLVPYVIRCYHSNETVREYSRFSEDIVRYAPHNKIFQKFSKVKSDLIFETSTPKYL